MWPFDQPVRQALRLPGETTIAWATFDPDWYRHTYAGAVASLDNMSDDAVLAFYLDFGQALEHSPNRYFDEAWHRRAYPNIAAAVRAGEFSSAFDAYCRTGNQDRAPHWLFDELYYRRHQPDLTNDVLAAAGLANGYDHFIQHGNREGRIGHPLFDPLYYLAHLEPAERAAAIELGPYVHYLRALEQAPVWRETSRYFDSEWYWKTYPDATASIDRGGYRSALEHYLRNDTPGAFDPIPDFSEAWYMAADPGLKAAVDAGDYRDGYAHFLRHGMEELRSPAPHIDLTWYANQDFVRESLLLGETSDAFNHWLRIGKLSGHAASESLENQIDDAQARALLHRDATALLPIIGRAPMDFSCVGSPVVSVIMVVSGDLTATLASLVSLRNNTRVDMDLILIVLGDSDIVRFVTGATIQTLDDTISEKAAFGVGLACARADAAVCLVSRTELGAGTIDAAVRRLHASPNIGAVGGKVLYPRGLLRSAGHLVWCDGTTHSYLEGRSPLVPEANFVRDVHFCPSAFLLVRTALLDRLRDDGASPPNDDHAAADLCVRMAAEGYRVVYDPGVMVRVWNDTEQSQDPVVDADRHAAFLANCHISDGRSLPRARYADRTQRRLLLIEDTIPLRGMGSGFVRTNDLTAAMAAMGFAVTVFPVNASRYGLASIYADMPDTVEVMHDRTLSRLGEFLRERRGIYDTIWIARTHNLDRVRPILDAVLADDPTPPSIILDTEALATVRRSMLAAMDGHDFDLDTALRQELSNSDICTAVVVVSAAEADMLRKFDCPDVRVIGHVRPLRPTARPFEQRAGMLFAGAIHRLDSPNYDSLCWFVDEVLPIVERSLGWETRLTIAGYTAPDITLERFSRHPRITLRGAVADLEPLYASHRLFVAPTRFAAGAPYKVHEAASFGLPVVATNLLSAQLGWSNGAELLSADATDPTDFAAHIVALYRDAALWTRLRTAALERLARDNNPEVYAAALKALLVDGRP